ncbi:MAG: alpha/beta hydrolase-fold protein [Candidatus Promineifilaceae bacterium]
MSNTPNPTLPPTNTPLNSEIVTASSSPMSVSIPTLEPAITPQATQLPQSASCDMPGRIINGRFPSEIDGPDRAYRIYLPPCYGEDGRTFPTLYLFHGGAHSDAHWDTLGIDEAADELIAAGVIPPVLIVMPDGGELANNSSGGPNSFEGLFIDELIPFIESRYCVWSESDGRALGGISRGGYWALEIAFRQPDQFGSVGGHSAALLDTDAGPDMNPPETGLTNELGELRIYLDIGDRDWLINEVLELHEDMSKVGVPHTWVLNEGQHAEVYWSEHLPEYLEWYAQPWATERDLYPTCVLEAMGLDQE